MEKSILVFSNGEKIGDGLIKLPLLNEIKRRLPEYKLVWMTDTGNTVYNNELKNISSQFIDSIFEKAKLSPLFWKPISKNYNLNDKYFEYILDTQKAVYRTLALKRIKSSFFISGTASGIFSNIKIPKVDKKIRNYYLTDLFDLLNLIKKEDIDKNFKFPISNKLTEDLKHIFNENITYIGVAPGAGENNKIWPLENFIKVCKFFEKKSYKIVFFLGPLEKNIKPNLLKLFPNAIFPEDIIKTHLGLEVVMASTQFLSCALCNDSGVSHMLSTNHCPLIKLFGPKDAEKFTNESKKIIPIEATEFGSKNINDIPTDYVIKIIEEQIK